MYRMLVPPVVLLLLLLASLAWSGSSAVSKTADFRFVNRGDVITLDLNQMSYLQDFRVTYGIRSGLYTYDPKNMRPIPEEAASYTLNDDKTVWTFKLRDDLRWSNGDKVTAHDYVFSWRRMLEEPGEYSSLFYYIKNAQRYEKEYAEQGVDPTKPRISFDEVGIKALDDLTLQVTLDNQVPFLLDLIAFPPFYPRHEASMEPFKQVTTVKKFAEDGQTVLASVDRVSYDPLYTRPAKAPGQPGVVTNGPFVLAQWEFKRRIRMEKNPHYWDVANVKSDSIEMLVNDNPVNQLLAYEAKGVEWLADVPAEIAAEMKARGRDKIDLRIAPAFGTAFLSVNCSPTIKGIEGPNPLADVRVRQALAMAIDRSEITEKVTRMGERPATGYIPPNMLPGYTAQEGFGLDLPRARELLAQAGFPGGKGFPTLPLLFNSENPTRRDFAQVLKNQWERNLGIKVELRSLEVKSYRAELQQKTYAIAAVAWYGDYVDPSTFTDKYRSTSVNNDSAWGPPEYDALLDRAAAERDPAKRMQLLEEAERMINTQVPIIPLYNYVNVTLYRDEVEGLELNPKLLTMLKHVHVKK
jgi:oligopeptide transport system substrate-binding protein